MAALQSRTHRRAGRVDLPDPAYWIWRRLTSVRIAATLIAIVALFALVGVVIPQVPPQFTDTPAAVDAFVNDQRGTWGAFTGILAEFPFFYNTNGGIFNLFNQPYWYALVAVLALSITTCTVSRFPPIFRTVRRPQQHVPDTYFERARNRFAFSTPADAWVIERTFRRKHFSVRVERRDQATYIFADRFQWAQLSTFAMHLALIMLVLGAVITKVGGEEFQAWVGEGQSWPLFAASDEREQVQISVDDAIARFNDDGQALDFRSLVRISQGGQEVAAGAVTVNGPLQVAGYSIHQAAYWEHGAALQVNNARSGQLLYSEVLFLDQEFFGPRVTITDALSGDVFSEEVVQLQFPVQDLEDSPFNGYTLIPLNEQRSLALVLVQSASGDVTFYYSLVPVAASAPEAEMLAATALHLSEPPPLAPRVRIYDAVSGVLLLDDIVTVGVGGGAIDGAVDGTIGGADAPAGTSIGFIPVSDTQTVAVGYESGSGAPRFFYFDLQNAEVRGFLQPGGRTALGAVHLEYVGADVDRSQWGSLESGASQRIGGITLTYGGAESVFFSTTDGVPGVDGDSFVIVERFGAARTAGEFNAYGGESVRLARSTTATSSGGVINQRARMGLGLGGGTPRVDLAEGESLVVGAFRYTFRGPREFTGLSVRRDPGATVFWIAIILGIGGLMVTFFVPRRRIWAKITPQRTYLVGIAGHGVNLKGELARFAREVDAPDAPPAEDWDNA